MKLISNMVCGACFHRISKNIDRIEGYYWVSFKPVLDPKYTFGIGTWVAIPMHKNCVRRTHVYPMIDEGDVLMVDAPEGQN